MHYLPPVQIGRLSRMGLYQQRCSITAMSPALWLDAADTLSIMQDAGKVSQWKDKSGNSQNFTQSTASSQPLTGNQTINGKNTLTFDGVDDKLLGEHITGLYDGLTAFIVTNSRCSEKTSGFGFAVAINGSGWLDGSENAPALNFSSGGEEQANWQIANRAHSTPQNEEPFVYACSSDGSNINYYANGNNTSIHSGSSSSEGAGLSLIGGISGANYFKGDIAEIIIFDRVLTEFERNNIGKYLAKKWGIN